MNTLTATERGDLAERMLPVAARITAIVHGDGDARDIAHALDQLDRIELVAVIVALGALANPDQAIADALGFITWDEEGRELPPVLPNSPVRGLVPAHVATPAGIDDFVNVEWNAKKATAKQLHFDHGLEPRAISQRLGVNERTVARWKKQWRAAA
jgi:hypothetical protein